MNESFSPRTGKKSLKIYNFLPQNKKLDLEKTPISHDQMPKRSKTSKVSPKKSFPKTLSTRKKIKVNKSFLKSESIKNSFSNELKLKNFDMVKSYNAEKKEEKKTNTGGTLNLLNHIRILIKAANLLRFRTKFRSIRFINETQIGLIDDQSNFPVKTQKDYYLKRFTEKNTLKKCYYIVLNCFFSNFLVTFLFDHYEKICKFFDYNMPVIKPFQKIKVLWDVVILLTIVLFFFLIPLQLSFGFNYEDEFHQILEAYHLNSSLLRFLVFIPELLLIMDSLLKCITGYYENGLVIIDKRKSFGIISEKMISLNGKNDYILGLIILIFEIIFFCHINACVWHSVAYYYPGDITWLDYAKIKNFEWSTKYYYSMFWSVSSMVTIGFGEKVSPQNNAELMIGGLIFLSSALFFGYTINCMREIFDEMAKHEKEYKECLSVINQYMNNKNINFELQGRVRKYLEYIMHKETNIEKENEILNKLTLALKKEVILESNGTFLYQIPVLSQNFSAQTLEQLAFSLKQVRYSPEEYIYHNNDIDDCSLFIVAKGEVEMLHEKENDLQSKSVHIFKAGEAFGIRSFFTDYSREISIRSRNFSTLFEIKQAEFLKIVKKNEKDYEQYLYIRDRIKLYENYNSTQLKCFCCEKKTHLFRECPIIHFVPDRDFLIKRFLSSKKQDRIPCQRKAKKKFNSRFNINAVQDAVLFLGSSVFSLMEENEEDQASDEEHDIKIPGLQNMKNEGEESKDEKLKETSENDITPIIQRKKLGIEEVSSQKNESQQENAPFLKKFPSKEEQQLVRNDPQQNETQMKSFVNFKKHPKFCTEENFSGESRKTHENDKEAISKKLKSGFSRKKTKEKQENEDISMENYTDKYAEYNTIWMFAYDFEQMKNFSIYFKHNNVKIVLQQIYEKQLSPASFGSKKSNKKKLEKRLRTSRFLIDQARNVSRQSKQSKQSDSKELCLLNNLIGEKRENKDVVNEEVKN